MPGWDSHNPPSVSAVGSQAPAYDNGGAIWNVKAFATIVKGDAQRVTDGAMGSGSAVLTSVSNKFAATDVGKLVTVWGAGAAGVVLATTILSFQNAGQVTLTAANASGGAVSAAEVRWSSDDTTGLQNVLTTIATTLGGSPWFGPGVRCGISAQLNVQGINLVIHGPGRQGWFSDQAGRQGGAEIVAMASMAKMFNISAGDITQAVNFYGLAVNGNKLATTLAYFDTNSYVNGGIDYCLFYQAAGDAVIFANTSYSNDVHNSVFRDNASGTAVKLGPATQAIRIRTNYFSRNGTHIEVGYTGATPYPQPVWIEHNAIASVYNAGGGMKFDNGQIHCNENYIEQDISLVGRATDSFIKLGVSAPNNPTFTEITGNRFNHSSDMLVSIDLTGFAEAVRIMHNNYQNVPAGGFFVKATGGTKGGSWIGAWNYGPGATEIDSVTNFDLYMDTLGRVISTFTVLNNILQLRHTAGTSVVETARVTGDANDRFRKQANGALLWGTGAATPDVDWYRKGAKTVGTDNAIALAAQSVALAGGTVTIDVGAGEVILATITASTTIAWSNRLAGQPIFIKLIHDATATAFTITWPGTVKFAGGAFGTNKAGTNTANSIDQVALMDDGTNQNEFGRALAVA